MAARLLWARISRCCFSASRAWGFPLVALLVLSLRGGAVHASSDQGPWLNETFDAYATGPIDGQGPWWSSTGRIAVVTTTSVAGKAVCLDADEHPLAPFYAAAELDLDFPTDGRYLLSFAVRVEARAQLYGPQAAIYLISDATRAIELEIDNEVARMYLRNDFWRCVTVGTWDLGDVPGGYPDLTTGTFHLFEIFIDLDDPTTRVDDVVTDVWIDGKSRRADFEGCWPAWIGTRSPIERLTLRNGTSEDDAGRDAVFFDNLIGRPVPSARARHWQLY